MRVDKLLSPEYAFRPIVLKPISGGATMDRAWMPKEHWIANATSLPRLVQPWISYSKGNTPGPLDIDVQMTDYATLALAITNFKFCIFGNVEEEDVYYFSNSNNGLLNEVPNYRWTLHQELSDRHERSLSHDGRTIAERRARATRLANEIRFEPPPSAYSKEGDYKIDPTDSQSIWTRIKRWFDDNLAI